MTTLPPGWIEKTLADVAQLGSGGTPQAKNPSYYGGEIPWGVIGDLNDGVVTSTARTITEGGLAASAAKIVPRDSILLAMYGASIGKIGIAGIPMATNQAIATIQVGDELDVRFLFYYLLSERRKFVNEGKGAAQPNISQTILKPWPVRFPAAIAEQRRIIAVLEDHLTHLEAGYASVSRSIRRLATLRDASLSAVVERARASHGVETLKLGDIAKVSSGMTPLKGNKSFYDGGTIPWITSGDLHQGMITRAVHFVTQKALDETSLKVVPAGALLIAMYGEGKTRGTAAELQIDAATNQACAVVQLHDPALRAWVRIVLDANYSKLRRLAAGGVQPNLNLSIIRAIEVPVPGPALRSELLQLHDKFDEKSSRLMVELLAAKKRANSLRHSLLTAAFSGDLGTASHDDSRISRLVSV